MISSDNQSLEAGAIVTLFQIDTSKLVNGNPIPFYFTQRMRESSYISFGGIPYNAIDMEATGFLWDGKGAFPTPTLKISNVGNLLTATMIEMKDFIGATVTRIRTFEKYLDDGSEPDPDQHHPLEVYTVEQKSKHNKVFVEWRLSSALDQSGRQLPGRTILRDVCQRTYRIWNPQTQSFDYSNATCPYSAARYYSRTDKPSNQAQDDCARRLTSCKNRFGANAVLPAYFFPGVGKTRV
jgi:lambda family phage minor tail protein L